MFYQKNCQSSLIQTNKNSRNVAPTAPLLKISIPGFFSIKMTKMTKITKLSCSYFWKSIFVLLIHIQICWLFISYNQWIFKSEIQVFYRSLSHLMNSKLKLTSFFCWSFDFVRVHMNATFSKNFAWQFAIPCFDKIFRENKALELRPEIFQIV